MMQWHEAIVPRNIFYAVQEEMLKRQNGRLGKNGVKLHYSSNNCFSNIVICANCEVTVKPDRSLYDIEEELDTLQLQLISRTYSEVSFKTGASVSIEA